MNQRIEYIHGAKLEPFSPPSFCTTEAALEEYLYYCQKGYSQITGQPCLPKQGPQQTAA